MKIIITGTTGMIGEGVLMACLNHPEVTEVLSVSRKPCGKSHPKLKEYIVPDFLSMPSTANEMLSGYDACFFCAGVSAVGKTEKEYQRITYDTTIHFANVMQPNPELTFIYVSGAGTDSTEKGKIMWARVKGKTENDLMKMDFKSVFGYRIGMVQAMPGQEHVLKFYRYLSWLFPIFKTFFPNAYNTIEQVAASMIYVVKHGYERNIIYVKDIHKLSHLKLHD